MDPNLPHFKLLEHIANGPSEHIDPVMSRILLDVLNRPVVSAEDVRDAIHKALDYGARFSLATTFTMTVLDLEWRRLGGSPDDPAPWREEIA